ncbi:hypothetical protein GCM10022225_12740 [Plantactinospora mayteni]|uniref:histidine kinase n=1 Tax=Plantactinospora mayteni TaxID=566021 RepID=A0ABQ4EGX7_9ACTN|nr:hypothetical protein Pma05_05460 [Plantactinospora mayteni]
MSDLSGVGPGTNTGLFEPFRRLQDRVVSGHGTGLGLSIVRSIAHAHGGDVAAYPRDAGGLIVTVTLPLVPAPDGDAGLQRRRL